MRQQCLSNARHWEHYARQELIECLCDLMLSENPIGCITFCLFTLFRPENMSFLLVGLPVPRLAGSLLDEQGPCLIDVAWQRGPKITKIWLGQSRNPLWWR